MEGRSLTYEFQRLHPVPDELLELGLGIPTWGGVVVTTEDADYYWDSEAGTCLKFPRFKLDWWDY